MSTIPKDDLAFMPLALPARGELLIPGRQYLVDPVARAVCIDRFGIRPPKFVECLHNAACARTITSVTTFADGRPSVTTITECPAREATFRAFYKHRRIDVFLLNLDMVESLRQFYADADVASDQDYERDEPTTARVARVKKPVEKIDLTLLLSL